MTQYNKKFNHILRKMLIIILILLFNVYEICNFYATILKYIIYFNFNSNFKICRNINDRFYALWNINILNILIYVVLSIEEYLNMPLLTHNMKFWVHIKQKMKYAVQVQ